MKPDDAPIADPVPAWDGADLRDLIAFERRGDTRFRNLRGDANPRGRAYGGQILAQALAAAARTVPPGRACTLLQLLFVQGARPEAAIAFDVTPPLQDGKRFSSRHVRGTQDDGRVVLDAQATFALELPAVAHAWPIEPRALAEDPASMPRLADLPRDWARDLEAASGYHLADHHAAEMRLPDPPAGLQLDPQMPRMRYWMRLRSAVGDDPLDHAAAFAYLSDWWVNYAAVGGHVAGLLARRESLYVASLNHTIWQHAPLRADNWLHVDTSSPAAASGRGLAIARVHDRSGRLVASVTQECVMAARER